MNVRAAKIYAGATRVITATLSGDNHAVAEGVTGFGYAPVLDLCRKLIALGYDPNLALIAMRGDTLALRIRSIGEAATLCVRPDIAGGFEAFRPGLSARAKTERVP
jgi:hypothetical protein